MISIEHERERFAATDAAHEVISDANRDVEVRQAA
jgi:hypothetical protein